MKKTQQTLPWKSRATAEINSVSVGAEGYGELSIPKLGCLTVDEEIAWSQYSVMVAPTKTTNEAKLDIAHRMLCLRLNLDGYSLEQFKQDVSSYFLVEQVFKFFQGERNRWEPGLNYALRVDGDDARELAVEYARKHRKLVSTRPDLAAEKVWFVFKDQVQLPEGFLYNPADDFSISFGEADGPAEDAEKKELTGQTSSSS